jgi:hypothetical protein
MKLPSRSWCQPKPVPSSSSNSSQSLTNIKACFFLFYLEQFDTYVVACKERWCRDGLKSDWFALGLLAVLFFFVFYAQPF